MNNATLVFGAFADKNTTEIYRELSAITSSVILPQFKGQRVMPPSELAKVVAEVSPHASCTTALSCVEAIALARQGHDRVLVTGSLHLAGEVLSLLRGMPAAFEECAQ